MQRPRPALARHWRAWAPYQTYSY